MFNKNITEIKKKNPTLAQQLESMDVDKITDINVYEAESKDYIISYKNIMLHSAEDPIREAKAMWHKTIKNPLKDNDIQVVYGLGLGYLFKRAYVEAPSKVVIYEPNLDILRFVLENVDFSNELADDRVSLFSNKDDVLDYVEQKYMIGDKIEVLFVPSYINFCKDDLINLSSEIYQVVKDKNIDKNTSALISKQAIKNLLRRVSSDKEMLPFSLLKNTIKNKPALVLSAGPSVKKDIELIKANKNKFVTFAVFPILSYLLENDVVPDFVVVADSAAQLFKLKNIEKFQDKLKNISLICDSRADYGFDSLDFKNSFLYFTLADSVSSEVFQTISHPNLQLLPSGSSVALLAFETAKNMGASQIVFSGLDLAFVGNEVYADSVFKIDIQEKLINIKMPDDSYQVNLPLSTVESASGGSIPTREDYLYHIREFEKVLRNEQLDIINTSLEGALIKGMSYISLEEVLKGVGSNEDYSFPSFKDEDFALISNYKSQTKKLLENTKNQFVELSKKMPDAIEAFDKIIAELSKDTFDNEAFQGLFSPYKETFAQIRQEITSNYLLGACLRSEIIDFLSGYIKDSSLSLVKFRQNFESEAKLLKQAKICIDDLLRLLDEIL